MYISHTNEHFNTFFRQTHKSEFAIFQWHVSGKTVLGKETKSAQCAFHSACHMAVYILARTYRTGGRGKLQRC